MFTRLVEDQMHQIKTNIMEGLPLSKQMNYANKADQMFDVVDEMLSYN